MFKALNSRKITVINISRALLWLSLLVITIVIYGQTASFGLITFDDPHYINRSAHVQEGLSWESIKWAVTSLKMSLWHPITWISYQIESSLFGADNNGARHAVNGALHFINSLLVYRVMKALGLSEGQAASVALIWAAHPQHVQAVAWVSERKELLAAMFSLAALLSYIKWWNTEKYYNYFLYIVFFAAALASKPSPIPMCIIMAMYALKSDHSKSIKKSIIGLTPVIIMAGTISVVTVATKISGYSPGMFSNGRYSMDLPVWLSLIPHNLTHYLSTAIVPWPLPFLVATPESIAASDIVKDGIIISLITFYVWRYQRKDLLLTYASVWFVSFWLPVSGLISLGMYYVADRYMYLPHIGLIMFGIVIFSQSRWLIGKKGKIVVGILVISFLGLSVKQASYWRNGETLFERDLEINTSSEMAAIYAGLGHQKNDKPEEALKLYDIAISINPKGYYGYLHKASLLSKKKEYGNAINNYKKAASDPYIKTRHFRKALFENLAWLLYKKGRYMEAIEYIEQGKRHTKDHEYFNKLLSAAERRNQGKIIKQDRDHKQNL